MNTILTILMITVMTYENAKNFPTPTMHWKPVISQQTIDYHYGKTSAKPT